jgi:hypothetical protein
MSAQVRPHVARAVRYNRMAAKRAKAHALLDQVVSAAAAMGMAGVERDARALLT